MAAYAPGDCLYTGSTQGSTLGNKYEKPSPVHLGYVKSQYMDGKSPFQGAWSGSRDPFKIFPNYIFGTDEARYFKCRVLLIDHADEFSCLHDILLTKGMCSESRA